MHSNIYFHKNTHYFYLFALLLMGSFISKQACAQIIFSEDFESGANDWTIVSNASDGGWNIGTAASISSQSFAIVNNNSGNIAGTNDDSCNCDKTDEFFISPSIDLTDVAAAVLKFDSYFTDNGYQGVFEDAFIEISTDGGNTWEILEDLHGHGSWDQHLINLTDYVGSEVNIGFKYDDNGGWLYGFGFDNVSVEVPTALQVQLIEVEQPNFGEVNKAYAIEGTVLNSGANLITSLDISYYIDGVLAQNQVLENLEIAAFAYANFTFSSPWIPAAIGTYEIEVEINLVNEEMEEIISAVQPFEVEVFGETIVPNKIMDFFSGEPVVNQIASSANALDGPTDLDFFPVLGKNELWIVNERNEDDGGSTLTVSNATTEDRSFESKIDGNSWHFMSLPTGIAFSDDNFNFANSTGVQDANHSGGSFTGPALWSSDPDIYAQPSGGNGSHLDMLHGSPFCMGIAHEVDNAFWVYDDWHEEIVRYDFVEDHGPGNDDHSDGTVRRYGDIGIGKDGDVPNHLILDKETGWLYFVDNGQDRVMRLDINSATGSSSLPELNEPLAEHSQMSGFTFETIIDEGLVRPCGIELFENYLLVGDYANGDIVVYDMDNAFAEVGRIETSQGLTGIKVGPNGNIWATNRTQNTLIMVEPALAPPVAGFDYTTDNTTVSLSNMSEFANNWTWSFGDGSANFVGQNPGNYEYAVSGDYEICLTVENALGTDEFCQTVSISYSVAPIADFSFELDGNTLSVNDVSSYAESWAWSYGDESADVDGQYPEEHFFEFNGTYEVCLDVTNTIGSDAICKMVEITEATNVGINDFAFLKSYALFPNPVQDLLSIRLLPIQNENVSIDIKDVTGRTVLQFERTLLENQENNLSLNTSTFANGLYFVHITAEAADLTIPFVVVK